MLKALLFAGTLSIMAGGIVHKAIPTFDAQKATAYHLHFDKGSCGGTAIGEHTLLTARHCSEMGGNLFAVDLNRVVTVSEHIDAPLDTSTVEVSGYSFPSWAEIGPPLKQGDRVHWWGNPIGLQDMYREGYVSHVEKGEVIIDATICMGDSGSGVFNAQGQVVGVIHSMNDYYGCTLMLAYPVSK